MPCQHLQQRGGELAQLGCRSGMGNKQAPVARKLLQGTRAHHAAQRGWQQRLNHGQAGTRLLGDLAEPSQCGSALYSLLQAQRLMVSGMVHG